MRDTKLHKPAKHKLLEELACDGGEMAHLVAKMLQEAVEIVVEDWSAIPELEDGQSVEAIIPAPEVFVEVTNAAYPAADGERHFAIFIADLDPEGSINGDRFPAMLLLAKGNQPASGGWMFNRMMAVAPEGDLNAIDMVDMETLKRVEPAEGENENVEQTKTLATGVFTQLAKLFAFLAAPRVELAERTPAPKKLNAKRAKKGKPPVGPLMEVRYYTKARKHKPTKHPEMAGHGAGTKKRRHMRRAHYRYTYKGKPLENPIPIPAYFAGEGQADGERWYHVI